jgi:DNA helicase-2/ATP-dependent DNA helicase PcrA
MSTPTTAKWSTYQQAIFSFIENETGSAVVEAVAGSGKSTTIVEGNNRAKGSKIFLAFNKMIAEELKDRGVNARTWHSLTYSPVCRFKSINNVETNKSRTLTRKHFSYDDDYMYGAFCARLVGLAKQSGIGAGLYEDTYAEWLSIVQHHDMELENENASIERAIELSQKLLMWSNESNLVDFDDMLYIAVRENIVLPKFDFVFVDEAQDTNAIQRALLRKIMHATTRVIAVGDPAQAIYGFRGADSNSLNMIAEEFNCKKLPLTVSYRCSKAVVEHAHKWVSHIEAQENAGEGQVIDMDTKWNVDMFKPGELVVCRTTKPLVALAYRMLRARIPVRILGREIGQGLKSLIAKMNARGVDDLVIKLEAWAMREVDKAIAKQLDAKAEAIQDKCDSILCLINSLAEDGRSIEDLNRVIDDLFANATGRTDLATIHKAKGLEADTVYWLNSSQCPAKWAKQPWQQEQERNLCYVATTRARWYLVLIEDSKKKGS